MRWPGHTLHVDAELDVDPTHGLSDAHRIAHDAEHALTHAVPRLIRRSSTPPRRHQEQVTLTVDHPAVGALLVVSGLPGVGKTAVATEIARRVGGVHLSVDPVEDALLACGLEAGWQLGVAAYEAVASMATANLTLGRTVVVDAVNDSEAARGTWRRVAEPVTFAVLTCSDPVEHRRRLEGRWREFTRLLEPTWSMVCDRAANYAPWSGEYLEVDTCGLTVAEVCDRLGMKTPAAQRT